MTTPNDTPRAATREEVLREFSSAHPMGGYYDGGTWEPLTETRVIEPARMADEIVRLRTALAAIDAACLKVCRDNTPEAIGEPDPEMGRYVTMNEDGDPLIDTNDPCDVIADLDRLWGSISTQLEESEADRRKAIAQRDAAKAALGQLTKAAGDFMTLCDDPNAQWDQGARAAAHLRGALAKLKEAR